MVRFLVIRFSSIGDIVLTTPVIRSINQQIDDTTVDYLTKPAFAEILSSNPYIHQIHLLKNNINDTIKELDNENYDYIIDLQNNLKSTRIKRALRKMYFTVDKLNLKKWIFVNFKINNLPDKHIVDRYLETLHLFDVENDNIGLDYFLSDIEQNIPSSLPQPYKKGYVCLVVGANHETKKMTPDQLALLSGKINKPVLLLGGPGDKAIGENIVSNSGKKEIINGCGNWSINESASIIKEALCVVAHDTGLMHIAAAYKKDIVTIWGNTTPAFGMYAYHPGDKSVNFEVKNLPCRPCSKLGKRKCPKTHFKCMFEHDIDSIAKTVNQLAQ